MHTKAYMSCTPFLVRERLMYWIERLDRELRVYVQTLAPGESRQEATDQLLRQDELATLIEHQCNARGLGLQEGRAARVVVLVKIILCQ